MICDQCGAELHIGDWPHCPHGRVREYHPFLGWYDEHLGTEITSLAQWNREMRTKGYELRDKITKGELHRRQDRGMEMKDMKRRAGE